ncbi:hypothetical protein EDB87DRAFT_1626073 [Lactarius vividus]|nr:hypothetical protein EDB87DRAFT_1626073 [Lactarius vividus]
MWVWRYLRVVVASRLLLGFLARSVRRVASRVSLRAVIAAGNIRHWEFIRTLGSRRITRPRGMRTSHGIILNKNKGVKKGTQHPVRDYMVFCSPVTRFMAVS